MASINKEIKCDLKTDGGGWILIQVNVRTTREYNYEGDSQDTENKKMVMWIYSII